MPAGAMVTDRNTYGKDFSAFRKEKPNSHDEAGGDRGTGGTKRARVLCVFQVSHVRSTAEGRGAGPSYVL